MLIKVLSIYKYNIYILLLQAFREKFFVTNNLILSDVHYKYLVLLNLYCIYILFRVWIGETIPKQYKN